MSNAFSLSAWFITFLLVLVLIGFGIYNAVLDYRYEREIGSYMETAKDTITPESFKEQMLLFKQAISTSGLTNEDYGAMWFKKPDNSMKFQMQHIDSIIGRADAMIQWQTASYNSTQTGYASPEAFKDVYHEKMNNLRTYVHAEGYRSDWIAKDAWYVKYHPFTYFSTEIILVLLFLIFLFGMIGGNTWE